MCGFAHRRSVHADSRREGKRSDFRRQVGENIFGSKRERRREDAILDPDELVCGGARAEGEVGIQDIHVRVRLQREVRLAALVEAAVLKRRDRFDHLAAGAEVIKLGIWQRNDGTGQAGDVVIMRGGTASHAGAHAGVEFVEIRHTFRKRTYFGIPSALFEKHGHRLGAQQPEAGIDKEEVVGGELGDFVRLGFLEEESEFLGAGLGGEENPKVRGRMGIHPHSEAKDVGIRHGGKPRRKAQENIPAGNHDTALQRGARGNVAEAGHLHIEQRLVEALAVRPSQGGEGHENLSRGGVGWQAAALSTGHEGEFERRRVAPFLERRVHAFAAPGFGEQVGHASAGAEFAACGIACGEPSRPLGRAREVRRHGGWQGDKPLDFHIRGVRRSEWH